MIKKFLLVWTISFPAYAVEPLTDTKKCDVEDHSCSENNFIYYGPGTSLPMGMAYKLLIAHDPIKAALCYEQSDVVRTNSIYARFNTFTVEERVNYFLDRCAQTWLLRKK